MPAHPKPRVDDSPLGRARLALEGLSVGDAFGGRFFLPPADSRMLPPAPWSYSDDSVQAQAIIEVLERHGQIEKEALAHGFARRYQADPYRGYGLSVRQVLDRIAEGVPWPIAAREIFSGTGSMGNGGAMRVASVGAFFADNLDEVIVQARASAEVTHAHPEGQAGAIAVAIAAAWAWGVRDQPRPRAGQQMNEMVLDCTPAGQTRAGIEKALSVSLGSTVEATVDALGNGSRITSPDTVPFALWCAARHIDDYEEALWTTVSAGGDNDTNCAIVGGIVVLANGYESIPIAWREAREPLG